MSWSCQSVWKVVHVFIPCKCIGDPSRVFPVEDIQISEELCYEEQLVAILDRQGRKLRNKEVRVHWGNNN